MIDVDKNIKLDYHIKVKVGKDTFYTPRAEFFMDEHGVQWVKFVPSNGYHAGREHMIRTSRVMIVREES